MPVTPGARALGSNDVGSSFDAAGAPRSNVAGLAAPRPRTAPAAAAAAEYGYLTQREYSKSLADRLATTQQRLVPALARLARLLHFAAGYRPVYWERLDAAGKALRDAHAFVPDPKSGTTPALDDQSRQKAENAWWEAQAQMPLFLTANNLWTVHDVLLRTESNRNGGGKLPSWHLPPLWGRVLRLPQVMASMRVESVAVTSAKPAADCIHHRDVNLESIDMELLMSGLVFAKLPKALWIKQKATDPCMPTVTDVVDEFVGRYKATTQAPAGGVKFALDGNRAMLVCVPRALPDAGVLSGAPDPAVLSGNLIKKLRQLVEDYNKLVKHKEGWKGAISPLPELEQGFGRLRDTAIMVHDVLQYWATLLNGAADTLEKAGGELEACAATLRAEAYECEAGAATATSCGDMARAAVETRLSLAYAHEFEAVLRSTSSFSPNNFYIIIAPPLFEAPGHELLEKLVFLPADAILDFDPNTTAQGGLHNALQKAMKDPLVAARAGRRAVRDIMPLNLDTDSTEDKPLKNHKLKADGILYVNMSPKRPTAAHRGVPVHMTAQNQSKQIEVMKAKVRRIVRALFKWSEDNKTARTIIVMFLGYGPYGEGGIATTADDVLRFNHGEGRTDDKFFAPLVTTVLETLDCCEGEHSDVSTHIIHFCDKQRMRDTGEELLEGENRAANGQPDPATLPHGNVTRALVPLAELARALEQTQHGKSETGGRGIWLPSFACRRINMVVPSSISAASGSNIDLERYMAEREELLLRDLASCDIVLLHRDWAGFPISEPAELYAELQKFASGAELNPRLLVSRGVGARASGGALCTLREALCRKLAKNIKEAWQWSATHPSTGVGIVNVVHEMHMGATTMAMQVLHHHREQWPCALLRKLRPTPQERQQQVTNLLQISAFCNLPVVVLLDNSNETAMQGFLNESRGAGLRVVVVVLRSTGVLGTLLGSQTAIRSSNDARAVDGGGDGGAAERAAGGGTVGGSGEDMDDDAGFEADGFDGILVGVPDAADASALDAWRQDVFSDAHLSLVRPVGHRNRADFLLEQSVQAAALPLLGAPDSGLQVIAGSATGQADDAARTFAAAFGIDYLVAMAKKNKPSGMADFYARLADGVHKGFAELRAHEGIDPDVSRALDAIRAIALPRLFTPRDRIPGGILARFLRRGYPRVPQTSNGSVLDLHDIVHAALLEDPDVPDACKAPFLEHEDAGSGGTAGGLRGEERQSDHAGSSNAAAVAASTTIDFATLMGMDNRESQNDTLQEGLRALNAARAAHAASAQAPMQAPASVGLHDGGGLLDGLLGFDTARALSSTQLLCEKLQSKPGGIGSFACSLLLDLMDGSTILAHPIIAQVVLHELLLPPKIAAADASVTGSGVAARGPPSLADWPPAALPWFVLEFLLVWVRGMCAYKQEEAFKGMVERMLYTRVALPDAVTGKAKRLHFSPLIYLLQQQLDDHERLANMAAMLAGGTDTPSRRALMSRLQEARISQTALLSRVLPLATADDRLRQVRLLNTHAGALLLIADRVVQKNTFSAQHLLRLLFSDFKKCGKHNYLANFPMPPEGSSIAGAALSAAEAETMWTLPALYRLDAAVRMLDLSQFETGGRVASLEQEWRDLKAAAVVADQLMERVNASLPAAGPDRPIGMDRNSNAQHIADCYDTVANFWLYYMRWTAANGRALCAASVRAAAAESDGTVSSRFAAHCGLPASGPSCGAVVDNHRQQPILSLNALLGRLAHIFGLAREALRRERTTVSLALYSYTNEAKAIVQLISAVCAIVPPTAAAAGFKMAQAFQPVAAELNKDAKEAALGLSEETHELLNLERLESEGYLALERGMTAVVQAKQTDKKLEISVRTEMELMDARSRLINLRGDVKLMRKSVEEMVASMQEAERHGWHGRLHLLRLLQAARFQLRALFTEAARELGGKKDAHIDVDWRRHDLLFRIAAGSHSRAELRQAAVWLLSAVDGILEFGATKELGLGEDGPMHHAWNAMSWLDPAVGSLGPLTSIKRDKLESVGGWYQRVNTWRNGPRGHRYVNPEGGTFADPAEYSFVVAVFLRRLALALRVKKRERARLLGPGLDPKLVGFIHEEWLAHGGRLHDKDVRKGADEDAAVREQQVKDALLDVLLRPLTDIGTEKPWEEPSLSWLRSNAGTSPHVSQRALLVMRVTYARPRRDFRKHSSGTVAIGEAFAFFFKTTDEFEAHARNGTAGILPAELVLSDKEGTLVVGWIGFGMRAQRANIVGTVPKGNDYYEGQMLSQSETEQFLAKWIPEDVLGDDVAPLMVPQELFGGQGQRQQSRGQVPIHAHASRGRGAWRGGGRGAHTAQVTGRPGAAATPHSSRTPVAGDGLPSAPPFAAAAAVPALSGVSGPPSSMLAIAPMLVAARPEPATWPDLLHAAAACAPAVLGAVPPHVPPHASAQPPGTAAASALAPPAAYALEHSRIAGAGSSLAGQHHGAVLPIPGTAPAPVLSTTTAQPLLRQRALQAAVPEPSTVPAAAPAPTVQLRAAALAPPADTQVPVVAPALGAVRKWADAVKAAPAGAAPPARKVASSADAARPPIDPNAILEGIVLSNASAHRHGMLSVESPAATVRVLRQTEKGRGSLEGRGIVAWYLNDVAKGSGLPGVDAASFSKVTFSAVFDADLNMWVAKNVTKVQQYTRSTKRL